ncbi:hypothetical protein M4I21_03895 [Cellulophaga sp. 20_2_10]|uniref:hypothetical protein n=1 Tax=Cellulophaga sp. 20_2_10 TaxID=2942476 RepID=UPI00201AE2D7|nr:hypothetical protein [Cellulophaga sp. 20_2_10]MCL5244935.1 hypothetical protein [Cellulophaga sp. 20_2_10]
MAEWELLLSSCTTHSLGVTTHLMRNERNWNKAKWIFESDGALRDIYIQDTSKSDWEQLISFLNSKYDLEFGVDKQNSTDKIDFGFVQKIWNDETGELETKSLTIDLNGIVIKSYFFCPEQIEFDIKPSELKSESELNTIIDFMQSISKAVKKQSILTDENNARFPLIKVDYENGIEKVLSKNEMIRISKKAGIYNGWFSRVKAKIFPKPITQEELEYMAMESACKPYELVSQKENVW